MCLCQIYSLFLKTGVTCSIFKQEGNLHISSNLLISLKITSEKISEFFLIIFVGISQSWDAFATFRFKISFSICFLEPVFNENDVFGDLLRIVLMSGWFSYLVTRFSNGSSEVILFTDKSSYFRIFNMATILEKKLFKIPEISLLLPIISSFSISVIFCLTGPLSKKKRNLFSKTICYRWHSYYQDFCNNPSSIYVLMAHSSFSGD